MNYINLDMIEEAKSALNLWSDKPFLRTVGRMMRAATNGDMTPRAQIYWAVLRAAGGIIATHDGYAVSMPTNYDVLDILLHENALKPILDYTDERGHKFSYDLSNPGWRHEAVTNTSFVLFMTTLFTWGEEEVDE